MSATSTAWRDSFLACISGQHGPDQLFDSLRTLYYYIKDHGTRFVHVNQNFLETFGGRVDEAAQHAQITIRMLYLLLSKHNLEARTFRAQA